MDVHRVRPGIATEHLGRTAVGFEQSEQDPDGRRFFLPFGAD